MVIVCRPPPVELEGGLGDPLAAGQSDQLCQLGGRRAAGGGRSRTAALAGM
jgi:hypothetical protein